MFSFQVNGLPVVVDAAVDRLRARLVRLKNTPRRQWGVERVGQMPVPIVAPAVCNAVVRLTGVYRREGPMIPETVLGALHSTRG